MTNYLLIFHGGGAPDGEEAQAEVMTAWTHWYDEMGEAVVDGGNPVSQAVTIDADGSGHAGGGANPATGYAIIRADSMDEAVAHSRRSPHLLSGGSVEVAETFQIM
jgi:hypothetical protein